MILINFALEIACKIIIWALKESYPKMGKKSITIILLLLAGFFFINADSASKLPKTEILGTEYYVYDAKKGESIYAIAKRFGWDLEELMRLNKEASAGVQKGTRLYYPTGKVAVVTEMPKPVEIDYSRLEPIHHKVKKGETVYSISRQYGVPLEVIYKYNPSTKKGVKQGEIIELPQSGNGQYYYYTLKKGDTLSAVSQKYNTSVEDILKNNPGLKVDNLHEGETIRISLNSNVGKIKTEMVAEERVTGITPYKVSKNETWEEISEKTGVEVELLKDANSNEKPKENSVINVPQVETVEIEKTTVSPPQEDMSEEEVKDLYDSIKGIDSETGSFAGVKMALILDEPSSKKDVDFTRGVLVALSQMKDLSYKIDLKVMDGRISSSDLTEELDGYEPNLIVSTADKTFPLFLADYGNTNNIQIVNVFDLKNDLYEDNASIVQVLPPSSLYNEKISQQVFKDNRRRKLVMVGENDENDGIASSLKQLFNEGYEEMTLEEFGGMEPDVMESYLIYSYANRKEDVSDFLKNVEALNEENPGFNARVMGRSSWMAMRDDFGDLFEEYNISIPSRVWLDMDSKQWKEFSEAYDEMFDGIPVRSIPNFAASGYDIAEYFIPLVAATQGDFNKIKGNETKKELLQNEINLSRVNNWGGFINGTGYIIRFSPNAEVEKQVVK